MNRQIRSVMDRYVASNIECCEFESQQGRFFKIYFFIYILYFYVFILSFDLEHSFNCLVYLFIFFSLSHSLLILFSSFYLLLNCIKCHNNKFQCSLLDESSARLMTNFSTSLSLAQYSASTFFTCSQTDRHRSAVMVHLQQPIERLSA